MSLQVRLLLQRGAGLTGLRSGDSCCTDTARATALQVLRFASPSQLTSGLICCQQKVISLFFLPMHLLGAQLSHHLIFTQANNQTFAGNDSDLLIVFGEPEQAASRFCRTRTTNQAEAVPSIYSGNIFSSWN